MAHGLLYAEQTVDAHAGVLAAAFAKPPDADSLREVAERTLVWTAPRPQPRMRVLAGQLGNDNPLRALRQRFGSGPSPVPVAPRMRRWPGTEALPVLETVGALATWLRLEVPYLFWLADVQDRNRRRGESALQHYAVRVVPKASGGVRLLESPKQHLKHTQRQILHEILDNVAPHEVVHGFRRGRSIVTFARPHVGQEMVLRLDLEAFFPSISGPRVQALFRTLGYPEAVADLLGGLCTTTTPVSVLGDLQEGELAERERVRELCRRSHLPQGAPTSPAIANLCAWRVDRRLAGLAEAAGAVYTRYADDLAFSDSGEFARGVERFALRVAAIVAEEGFAVNHRKTRVMRRSVRQEVAGITVNVRPSLPRDEVDRLKAILTNCVRFGPETQNREGRADFRAHLEGRVSFVAMVHAKRGGALRMLLKRIVWAEAAAYSA